MGADVGLDAGANAGATGAADAAVVKGAMTAGPGAEAPDAGRTGVGAAAAAMNVGVGGATGTGPPTTASVTARPPWPRPAAPRTCR